MYLIFKNGNGFYLRIIKRIFSFFFSVIIYSVIIYSEYRKTIFWVWGRTPKAIFWVWGRTPKAIFWVWGRTPKTIFWVCAPNRKRTARRISKENLMFQNVSR